jgi:hypothetical protein
MEAITIHGAVYLYSSFFITSSFLLTLIIPPSHMPLISEWIERQSTGEGL